MLRVHSQQRHGALSGPARTVGLRAPWALFALAILPWGPTALAQAPKGVVYVESNTPTNRILAFQRDDRGYLTPLSGSPFVTGGKGVHPIDPAVLGPLDSDQNIIVNPDRTRLFAVNSGSDTIAVFEIRSDGSLVAVEGSPFPSGGVNPVSVGLSGDILVVVNKDYDLGRPGFNAAARKPNYTTFRVGPKGVLSPVPDSTVDANPTGIVNGGIGPGNANPSQALVALGRSVMFDADFFGFKIHSLLIQPDGRLKRVDSQIIPPAESPVKGVNPLGIAVPLGMLVHPKETVLYVGFVLDQKVGVYDYDQKTGRFEFQRSVAGSGDALSGVCWFVANTEGTRLYTANNFNNTVSVLDTKDPRRPTVIQTVTLRQGQKNASPNQVALSSSGRFLHVVTQLGATGQDPKANSLQVLSIDDDGRVRLVDTVFLSEPETSTSRPQGVVAN